MRFKYLLTALILALSSASTLAVSAGDEYPYEAEISCLAMGQSPTYLQLCFTDSGSGTELEVRNGQEYGMYTAFTLPQAGIFTGTGLIIKLRSRFSISAQNASNNSILNIKILNKDTGDVLYQKSAGQYRTLNISNYSFAPPPYNANKKIKSTVPSSPQDKDKPLDLNKPLPTTLPITENQNSAKSSVYFLQIGAYPIRADAEAQKSNLLLQGVDSQISEFSDQGNRVWRVRIGAFDSLEDAKAESSKLNKFGIRATLIKVTLN